MGTVGEHKKVAAVTAETGGDVAGFQAAIENDVRRRDAQTLTELMGRVTGEPARMWGTAIVGFGSYHYAYASGREGDTAAVGFSPRKAASTVYVGDGLDGYADLLARLGSHTIGKSCLHLENLDGVDLGVLEELVRRSYSHARAS